MSHKAEEKPAQTGKNAGQFTTKKDNQEGFMSTTDFSTSHGYVNDYLKAGWEVPIPLPENQKYPPKKGLTGNVPRVTKEEVENAWENVSESANVGLRMQARGKSEILGIDVDHYESKQGRTYLNELMEELGDLNLEAIPRSTRRGAKSPSAQYFFRVPKGQKWESKVCADVDVVQLSHRYSAVWPSIVDGDQYTWYIGDERTDIPHVKDLPVLPERWVNHLARGKATRSASKRQEIGGYREALNWLRENISSWDVEVDEDSDPDVIMSPYMRDSSTSPEFIERLENNAHDTMVDAVHKCVMSASEGHHGLKAALFHIRKSFVAVVVEDGRRSEEAAKAEFERAVTGEVEKLAADVEEGVVRILNITPDLAMPNFFQYLGINPYVDILDIINEPTSTMAIAEIIARLKPNLLVHTSDEEGDTLFMEDKRHEITESRLRKLLNLDVLTYLNEERAKLPEEPEEGSLEERIRNKIENYYLETINLAKSTALKPMIQTVSEKLIDKKRFMPKAKLDTAPNLIGIGNNVLDFHLAVENPQGSLKDWLRPRVLDDYVTYSIPGDVYKGIEKLEAGAKTHTENLINTIFPSEDLRMFAQTACGYSIYGANKLQKVFVWYGRGGGGKGSLFDSMAKTLGSNYVSSLKPSQFVKTQSASPDPEIAHSLNTRVTFVDETDKGDRINAGALKSATENRSSRNLYDNKVVSSSGNTITFMTNNVFHFEHDSGVARRLAVIPFNADRLDVKKSQPSATGTDSQWRERDEEVAFMLEWLARGFIMASEEDSVLDVENYPKVIREATDDFVRVADPDQEFFKRMEFTGDSSDFIVTNELANEYLKFSGDIGMTKRAFSMKLSTWMKDQGHVKKKAKRDNLNGYHSWKYVNA